jgi:hypothetical protein
MLFCAWSTTVRLCYGSYLQEFSGILMGIYGVLAETERSARRVCKHFPATFFREAPRRGRRARPASASARKLVR